MRRDIRHSCFFTALFLITAGVPLALAAQTITLKDCKGNPQAAQELEHHPFADIIVTVKDASLESLFLISHTANQQSKTALLSTSQFFFEHIPAGTWRLCTASGQTVPAHKIEILDRLTHSPQEEGQYRGAMVGVGLAGGAAALAGVALGSSSSAGDSGALPLAGEEPPINILPDEELLAPGESIPVESRAIAPRTSPNGSVDSSPAATEARRRPKRRPDCFIKKEPDPLSPFF